jgi:hypothetical protein
MPPTAQDKIILDGALGLETNTSQHSGDPHTFRIFRDLVTDVGRRIVKRDGRGSTLGSVAGIEIQALHEYVYTDPTTGAESYHTLGAINGGSYIYRWNFVTTWTGQTLPFTPTSGGKWGFCNADNSVFAFNGIDALLIGRQTAPNTITWRTAGIDAPTFAPTYSLNATDIPVSYLTTGFTVTTVTGDATVTASGAGFTTGSSWNGKRIVINGNAYVVLSVTDSSHLELTEGFKEVGAAGLSWTVYPGVGDWDDIAPQYRFSYYNPTTGHASNPSPILQVTETFQVGRTIVITIPASAENQAAYLNGYTQIQLFRTPKSAGVPVALNEKLANVNSAVTTIQYIETATKFRDTYLTDFQAPLLNYKPPAGISSMAFQQERGWAVHRPSGRVIFTPTDVEVDFGVAIECWPPLYRRQPASAPRAVSKKGGKSSTDSLIIQTSGDVYSMEGYGSTTFNPYSLELRGSGSYLGASAVVDGQLVIYYADNRMMVMREDVAQKIQDRLNAVRPSLIANVRVHWFAANSRNYVLLSIPSTGASTANDYTYVFDLDLGGGPIYEWNFGVSAFATVHDPTTLQLQLFAGTPSGAVYRLFSGSHRDAGVDFVPVLRTALFRGDELRSDIKYVKIFVNDPQLTTGALTAWTGVLYLNEQTNAAATNGEAVAITFRQPDYRTQSAQGRELIWTPTLSLRSTAKVCQLDITFPTADADLWIEQIIIGSDIDQVTMSGQRGGAQA